LPDSDEAEVELALQFAKREIPTLQMQGCLVWRILQAIRPIIILLKRRQILILPMRLLFMEGCQVSYSR
jgi:hypothetical protein